MSEQAATEWIDDGHKIEVELDTYKVRLKWICPYQDVDLSGLEGHQLPYCRRGWDADGEVDAEAGPLDYCGVGDWLSSEGIEDCYDSTRDETFTVNPFPVEYVWNVDEVYVWRVAVPNREYAAGATHVSRERS